MKREPISTGSEWSFDLIERYDREIGLIAKEFQLDTFRPPTHHLLRARLGDDGLIQAIEHNVSSGDVMHGSPLEIAVMKFGITAA